MREKLWNVWSPTVQCWWTFEMGFFHGIHNAAMNYHPPPTLVPPSWGGSFLCNALSRVMNSPGSRTSCILYPSTSVTVLSITLNSFVVFLSMRLNSYDDIEGLSQKIVSITLHYITLRYIRRMLFRVPFAPPRLIFFHQSSSYLNCCVASLGAEPRWDGFSVAQAPIRLRPNIFNVGVR